MGVSGDTPNLFATLLAYLSGLLPSLHGAYIEKNLYKLISG
jgi:hypothetical protein